MINVIFRFKKGDFIHHDFDFYDEIETLPTIGQTMTLNSVFLNSYPEKSRKEASRCGLKFGDYLVTNLFENSDGYTIELSSIERSVYEPLVY